MATIPIDIIHSCILPRLPVKSLTRFKSVSKTWQTIISSSKFIRLHQQHTLSSDANRFIVFKEVLSFLVHEIDSQLVPSLHWHYPEHFAPIIILASSEFFLLINLHHDLGLVLLNPSTGRYYKIPSAPSHETPWYHSYRNKSYYGIYLDDANNDYKVVRISTNECFRLRCIETEVMVYSLRTNKWRLIERKLSDDKCYGISCNGSTVIRHLFYMLLVPYYQVDPNTNAKERIGCFDILAEKWTNDVPFPHLNDLKSIDKLSVLDGSLCVTGVEKQETGPGNFCVWVMKEYGVKDSWFKLMSIASDDTLYSGIYPIAFHNGSRHEILCCCRRNLKLEYIWYNVREKKATTATLVEGIYGYVCKGSLIDFPGGRNMILQQLK